MGASPQTTNRAYSLIEVKDFDPVLRTFGGTATSPVPDRVGDTIAQDGVTYKNPLPLLLYHNSQKPVGEANFKRSAKGGMTPFDARISTIDRESGVVRERLDEAVDSLAAKPPLIRGVSIGFRALEPPTFNKETGGFHFSKIEVLELSMVVIPAHQDATIQTIKSLDAPHLAATGDNGAISSPAGVSASPIVRLARKDASSMNQTYAEQIKNLESTIAGRVAEREAIHAKAVNEGRAKDDAERETFDTLGNDVRKLTQELADTKELEQSMVGKAVAVTAATPQDASAQRGGHKFVQVNDTALPPGIGFARAVKATLVAKLDNRNPLDVAKEMYPSDSRLHKHISHVQMLPNIIMQLKAAVPAATTTDTTWAGALADPTNLPGEFIEFLRPATIIGRLNLRGIPTNVRLIEQTQGGTGYWVGQGAPKPLTAFGFSPITLVPTKVAAIAVATKESLRYSTPSLDMLIRDGLRDVLVERVDIDLLDPAEAGSANVQPASLTSGLSAMTSAGTSADNVRTDLANLVQALRSSHLRGPIAIVLPDALLTAMAFMVNSLGQPEFPGLDNDGGTFKGIRFIGSEYVANASGGGNLVVAIAEREVFVSNDGGVTIDASDQASLQMLNNPTNNSATATPTTMVSMFQTNSVAFLGEWHINWQKRRASAVAYMDDVNWGSIGSPA